MRTLNAFDAAPGQTVAVKHGDLFDLGMHADLLVISAWENSYNPDPGSMVKVLLDRCGLVVGELEREVDFSQSPSIRSWVSRPIDPSLTIAKTSGHRAFTFRRIAVVESPKIPAEHRDGLAFKQMFRLLALLPLHGVNCSTVVTPLLNTGRQQELPESLFPAILEAIDSSFRHVPDLRQLIFADLKEAELQRLCDQIDARLHRTPLQKKVLSLDAEYTPLLQKLLSKLEDFQRRERNAIADEAVSDNLAILIDELNGEHVTPVTLGISARKLIEALVKKRLDGRGGDQSLFNLVKLLGTDISAWSANAIHTVRSFGNWMGHATPEVESEVIPRKEVDHDDMLAMLLALQRVLDDYPWPGRPKSPRRSRRGGKRPHRKRVKPLPRKDSIKD
jgi:hypothetical protein